MFGKENYHNLTNAFDVSSIMSCKIAQVYESLFDLLRIIYHSLHKSIYQHIFSKSQKVKGIVRQDNT